MNLSGKEAAGEIRSSLKDKIASRPEGSRPPGLAVLVCGGDPASVYYAGLLKRAGEKDGFSVRVIEEAEETTAAVVKKLEELNSDASVDAVIVQLPLPEGVDKNSVFDTLSPEKDADGQTPGSLGALMDRGRSAVFPATARAIIGILKSAGVNLSSARAAVIGRSTAVGLPAAMLLTRENATVTVCHSRTEDLAGICRNSDIIVAAAGKPGMITADMVKEGAAVVDVGTSEVDGDIVGDADYEAIEKKALVSPVKGGVGSLTLACLLENTYELYRENIKRN
jgi:methylenetetrahydrofolate dehydrogenase (NADP+)/methenyltetrahydrofolate cyclohydrolase